MTADRDADVVFVADAIERQFPEVHPRLAAIFREHNFPTWVSPGTLQARCRDYLPVPTTEGRFVQIQYEPDYMDGGCRGLRADGKVGPRLPRPGGCTRSGVVLDGGNVLAWGDRAIATDKVFRENPGMSREVLVDRLMGELGLAELIVVPPEPYDPSGHADGMVAWLDGRTARVNDYSAVSPSFRQRFRRSLRVHGIDLV